MHPSTITIFPDTSIGEVTKTLVIGIVIGPVTSDGAHLEYAKTAVKKEERMATDSIVVIFGMNLLIELRHLLSCVLK